METVIAGRRVYHHDDYLWKILAKWQYYEKEWLVYSMWMAGKKEWLILDIWSNIGNHTLYRALKWQSVIAFEPDLQNYELLKKNVGNFTTVRLYNDAVSNIEMPYDVVSVKANMWANHLKKNYASHKTTVLIDDIIEKRERVKLIKVDVEWWELEVLMGAYNTIMRNLPDLMVEVNNIETLKYIQHLWYVKVYWQQKNKTFYFVHKIFHGDSNSST